MLTRGTDIGGRKTLLVLIQRFYFGSTIWFVIILRNFVASLAGG